ncbi:HbrB-like-domain-containing protein [Tricharina praecox]|uniref:HbrB-like-domain-containing protein n=1 Tax=Tricharina praecox TaxID=43433 RepID=UPI002220492D|nr:HbrB-like-domain-containing protein [Tricharina praecox]KAI5856046.1 HbrB-like-domain-containing protein [Tricharina praecox]
MAQQQQQQQQRSQQGPGNFGPTLMHPSVPTQQRQQQEQQPPQQQAVAAYAMQSSMRKRSATEPSPTSPPLLGSIMSGAAASAIFHATAAMNIPHAIPHPPPPPPSERTLPSPSTSAPAATKKEGMKKIFSKPGRIGTPGIEKTLRPPPSPNKLPQISSPIPRLAPGNDESSRRPSYSSAYTSSTLVAGSEIAFSVSPPTTIIERGFRETKDEVKKEKDHHRTHFLRTRRDKDHGAFSSSNSNSKMADAAGSLYSFTPSSPSSTVFASSKDLQKTISGIDITSASKTSKTFKAALGGGGMSSYEDSFLALDLGPSENAWSTLCARVLPLFDGDLLRNTVEDLNRLVALHIKRCVDRREPVLLINDVRMLLETGMSSIEPHLNELPDERLLSRLVEIWSLVFRYTTPYLEAVLLPLQQEFKGSGSLLTPRESREFFGVDVAATAGSPMGLDVRRLIMIAMRDCIVLPVYERLRVLFSRLQLDLSGNHEDGMEVVGRMLQCVSVLAAAGTGDEAQGMVDELGKRLKWNWLSRGRTGRNRKGFVGTKMRPVGVGDGGSFGVL